MNSDMSFETYYERDEQSFGYFLLGQKVINTETITCLKMDQLAKLDDKVHKYIDSKTLNCVLRNSSVNKIYLTVTEPIFLCVSFTKFSGRSNEFYKISFGNFIYFQQNFCDILEKFSDEKRDWLKNGF